MTSYLLAAEADKIQDFIFRSSRLREVVGGSQLLSRFCEEVPRLLLPQTAEVIVADGGSFRILFENPDHAKAFGEELAEVYRLATGGSLTVTPPVKVEGLFCQVSEQAEETLRQAKRWCENWRGQEQSPYVAFCASCGVGLAAAYRTYYQEEGSQYLCDSCLKKDAERAEGSGQFLDSFYQEVVREADSAHADWPGKSKRLGRFEKDPVEDVADYDPRRYVAYLLADGNAMGEVFGKCESPKQMRDLSQGLIEAIRRALADPTRQIMSNNPLQDRPNFVPVLPLILGGDDLFALIPAPWALDFAQRFCQAWEREMADLLARVGLSNGVPRPTVSAAVVICKNKHPYALAHEAGEVRLREAKQLGKRRILDDGQPYSTLNFEVMLGGRLSSETQPGEVRPTLRPYWVTDKEVSGWGLTGQWLIDQRYALHSIPATRLSEFQALYDVTSLGGLSDPDKSALWQVKLERLVKRIEQRDEGQGHAVEAALKALGGNEANEIPRWHKVDRPPEDIWYGHGLPDLLEAWDFALKLDKPRREYEEGRACSR